MSEREVAKLLAEAHRCFDVWHKFGVPQTATTVTRKSLEQLAKALDGLDHAAHFHLVMTLGNPRLDSLRAGVQTCLKSVTKRGRKSSDIAYRLGVRFLVLAWEAKHRGSPLSQTNDHGFKDFKEWAKPITDKYGAPVPGEKEVRRWVKGRQRRKS